MESRQLKVSPTPFTDWLALDESYLEFLSCHWLAYRVFLNSRGFFERKQSARTDLYLDPAGTRDVDFGNGRW